MLERGIEVLEAQPPGEDLLKAYVASAFNMMARGLYQLAIDRGNQALDVATQIDDPPARHLASALGIRGSGRLWSGDPVAGERDLLRALDIARAHNLTTSIIGIDGELGLVKLLTESASAAIPYLERGLHLASDTGHKADVLLSSANLAEALTVAGRVDEALAVCEKAAGSLADTDSPYEALLLQLAWSRILSLRGDFERAASLVAEALPVARGADPLALVSALLQALSGVQASQSPDPTARSLNELVATLQDPDQYAMLAQCLPELARLLCSAGHADLVARIVSHVPVDVLLYQNAALTARAVLAETEGDLAKASQLYAQATTVWAAYGHPLEQAHALLGAARCSLALDLPALKELLEARSILTQLGAAPLLAETDQLLDEADERSQRAVVSRGPRTSPPPPRQ